jgi:hypothetical protein
MRPFLHYSRTREKGTLFCDGLIERRGEGSSKFQVPSPREASRAKLQYLAPRVLNIEDWMFSGAWYLELGFSGRIFVDVNKKAAVIDSQRLLRL